MPMRIASLAGGILLASPLAADPVPPIDLNRPGAIEELERSAPDRHRRIAQIIRTAERVPCRSERLKALEVELDVSDLDCSFFLKTSLPPKRRVAFSVDGLRYVVVVTLRDFEGRITPAEEAAD